MARKVYVDLVLKSHLAKFLEIDPAVIGHILNGRIANLDKKYLKKVAEKFGVPEEKLALRYLGRKDSPKNRVPLRTGREIIKVIKSMPYNQAKTLLVLLRETFPDELVSRDEELSKR